MNRRTRRQLVTVLFMVVAAVAYFAKERASGPPAEVSSGEPRSAAAGSGEEQILQAFTERRSDVWVEAAGTVDRNLADDLEGSRHQRFILQLPSGHTILVSHNIDLADRIMNLRTGDAVSFRGEYEWNEQGGVVHWTHHDPKGRHDGGWLEHGGRRYR